MRKNIVLLIVGLQLFGWGCSNRNISQKPEAKAKPAQAQETSLEESKKIEFEFYFIEGLKQMMIGSTADAIQYFNNCLQINPKSAAVMYELAKIHVMNGDYSSARLMLINAKSISPDNKWYNQLLAQLYQNNKEYNEASKIYTELISQNPENPENYYFKAINLTSAEKYDEAIKTYNQIEAKFGFNEQINVARQQLYRASGKKKEAYAEIEKLIKQSPSTTEYYGIMADMYKLDGDEEKALEYYNKILEIDPNNGFVHFSLASFYLQNKNLEKTYEEAKTGFANPDVEFETKAQLYLMLVNNPYEQKLTQQQIEELVDIIVKTHPSDSRSYSIKTDILIQQEKYKEAREYLKKSLEIDPNRYSLWDQMVFIDNQLLDWTEMTNDSKKAIELFPTQPLLYMLNSIALIQLKQYKEALSSLETGQNYLVDNKKIEAQYEIYRAEAHYNLNNYAEAFTAFDKVLALEPDNYMAMNNYAYYLSVRGEQLEKAESMSSKVVVANPDNSTYLDTHAWVLFKRKEYRLAKHYMEIALNNGGDVSDVIVEHYGDILFMLNDIEGAVAQWKKSKELGNPSEILQQKIDSKSYIEEKE